MFAGCSQGKVAEKDGKVYVYDGTWPEESAVDGVKDMEAFRDDFQTENPDIVIVDDAGNYIDSQTYAAIDACGYSADYHLYYFFAPN